MLSREYTNRGHPRSKIAKKGQISIFFKSKKVISKNEALAQSERFKKVSLKVICDQPRSPEVRSREKMVKFQPFSKVGK